MEYKITPGKWVYEPVTYRQRYWHTRSDGVRQRYWHTVTKPGKRFEPEVVRVTVGWSGGAEKKYKSMTWQKWVENTEEDIAAAKREGRKWVKDQVQNIWGKEYGKGSWWDFMKPGGAAEQRAAKDVFNEAVDSVVGKLGEIYSDVAEWER